MRNPFVLEKNRESLILVLFIVFALVDYNQLRLVTVEIQYPFLFFLFLLEGIVEASQAGRVQDHTQNDPLIKNK